MTRLERFALFAFLLGIVILLVVAIALLLTQFPHPRARRPVVHYGVTALGVSYSGTDYYYPSEYFGGCGNWTWLTSCYTSNPSGGSSTEQQVLASDVAWIASRKMGNFQRIWVMLDQGIRWHGSIYAGIDPVYLSNLDDALAKFHAYGIRVDAVLLEASKGSSDKNQFQAQALDGNHASLRAGYLSALQDFARHIGTNAIDAATVAVVDEMNEAYYQLEQFGLSDNSIHSFLHDEYMALHAGDPSIVVTASDTSRLVKDYTTWGPMYNDATDAYDIHAYSDTPWNEAARWATAKSFSRAWFVGEAGCASGNVSCTYSGNVSCVQPAACAESVDSWWLTNLKADGAQAVLVEERNTAWSYAGGINTQTATAVGQVIQQLAGSTALRRPRPRPQPRHTVQPCPRR